MRNTGLLALPDNPRYDSVKKRAAHPDEIVPRLREALAARTALEWEAGVRRERALRRGARARTCSMTRRCRPRRWSPPWNTPVGSYRGLASGIKFGDGAAPVPQAAPTFGQHSADVLADLGYAPEEIARLRALGVIL